MTSGSCSTDRPLSPHLQIYKPQITSVLSITHRMAGTFLFFGLCLLVLCLAMLNYGVAEYNAFYQFVFVPWYGQLLQFGLIWALCYYLCHGIRHFFWDLGKCFELKNVTISAIAIIIVSTALSVIVWGVNNGWF